VSRGELLGIMGPNGAGKTSFLNVLNGLYKASAGTVSLLGTPSTSLKPRQVTALGVARSLQSVESFMKFSVRDLITLGSDVGRRRRGPGLPLGRSKVKSDIVEHVIEQLGVGVYADRLMEDLPYGLAKLADLGRTLASDPEILLLDEPASGLSSSERHHLARILRGLLTQRRDLTIVMIEHDSSLVSDLCSRLVVLGSGHILSDGTPDEVFGDTLVQETLFGMETPRPINQEAKTSDPPNTSSSDSYLNVESNGGMM
jgi:branched-chain amino acid transport system ATP-binding protein